MNDNLLQDIGENYEYAKTIVKNTIELKKIEAAEAISAVLGKIIFGIFASIVLLIVLMGLTVIAIIWLSSVLGSVIQAISIFCGLFLLLLLVVYFFRTKILYEPSMSFINSFFTFENPD